MTITTRQFIQLSEMGIDLWQQRSKPVHHDTEPASVASHSDQPCSDDDLKNMTTSLIFNDIIRSIGLSIGEISMQQGHLDLGIFNWQFSTNAPLQWHGSLLTTPGVADIAKSTQHKRQLWQLIQDKGQQ